MRLSQTKTCDGCLFVLQASYAQEENSCNDCHEVDLALFESTPHGDTACLDCHIGGERRHRRGLEPVECGECHTDALVEHSESMQTPIP